MQYTENNQFKLPDYTDNVDIQDINDNFIEIDAQLAKKMDMPSSSVIYIIPHEAVWHEDASVPDFPYYMEYEIDGLTTKDIVNINIAPSSIGDATACGLCGITESLNGKVRVRTQRLPSTIINGEYFVLSVQ